MAWYIPQSATSANTIITLTSNEGATILPGVSLVGIGAAPIFANDSNNRVEIMGAVATTEAGSTAVAMGNNPASDSGNRLDVAASGVLSAPNGGRALIVQGKNFTVNNAGQILGGADGGAGIFFTSDNPTGTSIITNSGTIRGFIGISRISLTTTAVNVDLINTGLIEGALQAYTIAVSLGALNVNGIDRITNSGTMKGSVDLSDGDDLYDGKLGTVIGLVSGGSGNDAIHGGAEKNTLSGDDGNDTLSGGGESDTITGGAGGDTISGDDGDDLVTGDAGNDSLSGGAGIDTLGGGDGDDQIKGDDGNDMLTGDAGNDALTGGAGADKLTGGAGADRFVYLAKTDSAGKPNKPDTLDLIADFSTAEDVIDLSAIDANAKRKLDQAFTYIETDRFSGRAGELRSFEKAGETWLQGDLNGDRRADFAIRLSGSVDFSADDFIL